MLILGVMVLLYVAGAWSTSRGTLRLSPVQVVWVGLIARLVLAVGSFPHLSDDVWRYMWDGHMQVSGLNPYSLPPASEALAPLRTEFWPLINHPEVPTIYPPAAQLVFAMVMALGGSLIGMRLVMVAVELATLGAVWRLMGRGEQVTAPRRSLATVLLWWNPLMMVEFASSGHLDMLAIAALVWALALIVPQRIKRDGLVLSEAPLKPWPWWWAGVWIGLSASFKLLGMVALAPLVVWAWWPRGIWTADVQGTLLWSWRRALARVVMVMAGCAVVLVATAVPYVTPVWFGESGSFAKGLSTYARKWQANAGLFAVALEAEEQVLETVPARPDGGQPWWRFDALADLFKAVGMTHTHEGREVASTTFGGVELAAAVVKLGVALVLGLLLLLLLYQRFEPDRIVLVMLAALLLLAPTVHPWYVAWLVPLSVAQEGRARSLVVWSVLVLLIYADQVMGGTVMLRLVEYGVVLPYALLQGWRSLVGLDMEGVRTA
ncbi:MAG: hypothetical protein AAFX99_11155 [Myxococcota bacterium]